MLLLHFYLKGKEPGNDEQRRAVSCRRLALKVTGVK